MAKEARTIEAAKKSQTGDAVKARRLELGLRIEDVASRAKLSLSTVIRVERGEDARIGTLRALADALETSVASLLPNGEAA